MRESWGIIGFELDNYGRLEVINNWIIIKIKKL